MSVVPDSVKQLNVNECEPKNGILTANPEAKCLMKGVTISRYNFFLVWRGRSRESYQLNTFAHTTF